MTSRDDQARSMAANGSDARNDSTKKGRLARLPGGNKALAAFGISLISYTLQTEAAQYVQQGLGYRKPLLSLYLGHSGFSLLLPAHLLFLTWSTGLPLSHYLHLIAQNLHWQLKSPTRNVKEGEVQEEIRRRLTTYSGRVSMSSDWHSQGRRSGAEGDDDSEEDGDDIESRPRSSTPARRPTSWRDSMRLARPQPVYSTWSEHRFGFDAPKFLLLLLVLMAAITIPALSWYTAVPMTSMADITALYNTFSVWALVFSVWFLGEKWSRYKVMSVVMACGGVVIVAYGGAEHRKRPKDLDPIYGKPGGATPSTSVTATSTAMATSTTAAAAATLAIDAALPTVQAVTRALLDSRGGGEALPPAGGNDASNPLVGDLLALFAAVTMAAYEMAFKLLGTLPDEEEQRKRYDGGARGVPGGPGVGRSDDADESTRVDGESEGLLRKSVDDERDAVLPSSQSLAIPDHIHNERTAIWEGGEGPSSGYGSNGGGTPTADVTTATQPDVKAVNDRLNAESPETESVLDDGDVDEIRAGSTRLGRPRSARYADDGEDEEEDEDLKAELRRAIMPGAWIPPPLPFGLHANIMTTGIGAVTFATLWIGLIVAHVVGWEPFEWPHNWVTVFAILFVVVAGIIFNGCFMVLLAIWGPVTASVSCLLSTVAVAILDGILGSRFSLTSALGCLFIMAGFGLLLAEPGGIGH